MVGDRGLQRAVVQITVAEKARTILDEGRLTFGTISSLFGLSHKIIDTGQYSALVAAVIASAVIPTVIANAIYLPHHLLPEAELEDTPGAQAGAVPLRHVGRKAE